MLKYTRMSSLFILHQMANEKVLHVISYDLCFLAIFILFGNIQGIAH